MSLCARVRGSICVSTWGGKGRGVGGGGGTVENNNKMIERSASRGRPCTGASIGTSGRDRHEPPRIRTAVISLHRSPDREDGGGRGAVSAGVWGQAMQYLVGVPSSFYLISVGRLNSLPPTTVHEVISPRECSTAVKDPWNRRTDSGGGQRSSASLSIQSACCIRVSIRILL